MSADAPSPDPVHPSHRVMVSRGAELAWLLKWLVVRPVRALLAAAFPAGAGAPSPAVGVAADPILPAHRVMVARGGELGWLLQQLFVRPARALGPWARRARERSQLAAMDTLMRHDLGLSPALIQREVNKPVWIV